MRVDFVVAFFDFQRVARSHTGDKLCWSRSVLLDCRKAFRPVFDFLA